MIHETASGLPRNSLKSTLMTDHYSTANDGQAFVLKSGNEFASRSSQVFEGLKGIEEQYEKKTEMLENKEQVEVKPDPVIEDVADESDTFKKPQGVAPRKRKCEDKPPDTKESHGFVKFPLAGSPEGAASNPKAMQHFRYSRRGSLPKKEKTPAPKKKTVFHMFQQPNRPPSTLASPSSSSSTSHGAQNVSRVAVSKKKEPVGEQIEKEKYLIPLTGVVEKSRLH